MGKIQFRCGMEAALAVLGGKWKLLVLYHLAHGVHRYGELKRAVGSVSDKVLIAQLKELQLDDVIERSDFKEVPPRVEYSLTPFGRSLAESLKPLCVWGEQNMSKLERISSRRQ
jgi:DNA-binding HxlR family transcriptional regulator